MKKGAWALAGAAAVALALGSVHFWNQRDVRKSPVKAAAGQTPAGAAEGLVIDAGSQKRAGIQVATARPGVRSQETETIAAALSPQELIDAAAAIATARAQLDKANASLSASRHEYERLRKLHADDRNVSDKVFQSAEAAWHGEEAMVRAAQASLDATLAGTRRKWGDALAAAAADNAPLFRRLSAGTEVLLRVALPGSAGLTRPPGTLTVIADRGNPLRAALIAVSPQADPRIQGTAFFYGVPNAGIASGMTLAARLPGGPKERGAELPDAAVVWWQGKAWTYLRTAPERFERRELPGARQIENGGWFVPDFPATPVVVRGAQTLLSHELRAQIKVGEGGEDND